MQKKRRSGVILHFVSALFSHAEPRGDESKPVKNALLTDTTLGLLAHILRRWLDPPGTHPNHLLRR